MGLEPYLLASTLNLVVAQRLVRKICDKCKEPVKLSGDILKRLKIDENKARNATFYHGKGCPRCGKTGYLGRTGILESLTIDDRIRDMIIKRAPLDEIKKYALSQGMTTLRDGAFQNLASGVTTLEEVLRITTEE